jgi:hypothetical protein
MVVDLIDDDGVKTIGGFESYYIPRIGETICVNQLGVKSIRGNVFFGKVIDVKYGYRIEYDHQMDEESKIRKPIYLDFGSHGSGVLMI